MQGKTVGVVSNNNAAVDNDYGSLAAGRYGNVILADKELNIKAVIQKGTRIV